MTYLRENLSENVATAPRRSTPGAWAPWIAEARALLVLATPLVLTQLAQMAIGTTDLLLLGRYSQSALAAAAIGNTIYYFAWILGAGPAMAVAPMIAHILGERATNRGGVRAVLRMGLWAVGAIAVIALPIMWSAGPILLFLRQDPELARGAGHFVALLSIGLPFSLGFMVLRSFATALGHPRAGLVVMGATIAVNALAGWALIFGHFGAPRMGIAGSGLATSASSVFGFLAMLAIIQIDRRLRVYRISRRFARPAAAKLSEIFRMGLPIGAGLLFEVLLFNAATLLMGTFGAASLAANQIAMNVSSITFMVPLGVGMACIVRVGLAKGGGDAVAVRRAALTALTVAGGFSLVSGAVVALASTSIAGLYLGSGSAENGAVVVMAAGFLKLCAAFQLFDGLQVAAAQALRGLKDTRVPMIVAGASYWLVGAPACLLLGVVMRLQGLGVWIGFVICLAFAAVAMCARLLSLIRLPAARGAAAALATD